MAIVGNDYLEDIYLSFSNINQRICQTLDYLYQEPEKILDSVDIELLDEEEHFYITCCSALIIWHLKKDHKELIPKWVFDDRLKLKELYVFGVQYRKREMNFVVLLLNSPGEFTMKNVIFDPEGLVRM